MYCKNMLETRKVGNKDGCMDEQKKAFLFDSILAPLQFPQVHLPNLMGFLVSGNFHSAAKSYCGPFALTL